jgi:hypothetical protein
MAEFVKDFNSSHWYTKNAEPMYSVIGKNGKERNTNVKDARELELLPSVTTIISLLARPELENWKIEQVLLASLTLPKIDGESDNDYIQRIIKDSKEYSKKAMDFGTQVHAYIEAILSNTEFTGIISDELKTNIQNFISEHQIYGSCEVLGADGRKAGKVDFLGSFDGVMSIIDWKTSGKTAYYDSYLYQLVAYRQILRSPEAQLVSVVINKEDMSVNYHIWEKDKIDRSEKIIYHLTELFYLVKNL